MRQGLIDNVPVSVGFMDDNVISIWADPSKVNNHFGNRPIYGTVEKYIIIEN
jgi:hypothetical protein